MEVEQGFKSDFFPQTAPVSFKTGINFKGLEKKLHEINQEISDSHPVLQLSPDELYIFGIALGKLMETTKAHTIKFDVKDFAMIPKMLSWPGQKLFPVLHFLRCAALHSEAARCLIRNILPIPDFLSNTKLTGDIINDVFENGIRSEGHQANKKLSLWFLVNLFEGNDNKNLLLHEPEYIEIIEDLVETKQYALVASSLIVNLSVMYLDQSAPGAILFPLISSMLKDATNDDFQKAEQQSIQLRLLIALGTLTFNNKTNLVKAATAGCTIPFNVLSKSTNDNVLGAVTDLKKLFNMNK